MHALAALSAYAADLQRAADHAAEAYAIVQREADDYHAAAGGERAGRFGLRWPQLRGWVVLDACATEARTDTATEARHALVLADAPRRRFRTLVPTALVPRHVAALTIAPRAPGIAAPA